MQNPQIRKILLNDYLSFLLMIGGPIALGTSVFTASFGFIPKFRNRGGQEVDPQFALAMCIVAIVITVLLLYFLVRRIARIKHILTQGPKTRARVLEIEFIKDRGRIEFEYTYQNQQYKTGAAVMKNKSTISIAQGDIIEVALDPDKPGRAFIIQLFMP